MQKLTLTAAITALALPAMAEDTAVLIGVDRYDEFRRVSGALDIVDAAADLRDAGFTVSTLSNGSSRDTQRVLGEFAQDIAATDRLVVGLSGRFATDGTRTWFMTEDSDVPTLFGLGDAISVETVLQVLAQAPGQAVLVLGYRQSDDGGLGAYLREGVGDLDVPQGVTVIYGEPDRVDDVFSRGIAVAGGDVMGYVRSNNRLSALGYQPRSLILTADEGTRTLEAPTVDLALRAWNAAQGANTADSYRDFLFEFPGSRYAAEARTRLDNIENNPERLAELGEDELNLTRNERRAIQRNLTLLDFNTRGVDGIFGPGTRGAIRNWQQVNGFAQTSYLNASQINRLDAQASTRAAEIEAEEEREREQAERLDREYWEQTGARENEAGYRAYLDRFPDGIFADQARAEIGALEETVDDAAAGREDALNLNPVLRRLIESRLSSLGYDTGNIDGRFDQRTRRAIATYQSRSGVTSTGYIDQATLARLLSDTFGR